MYSVQVLTRASKGNESKSRNVVNISYDMHHNIRSSEHSSDIDVMDETMSETFIAPLPEVTPTLGR
jgi:hypothetical protein